MLEMSIKSFVPRGRKLRTENASCLDPGADEPTEEEHALLQKYAQPPGEMPWKPSLIAFPSFQLLPTPIYTVKHSVLLSTVPPRLYPSATLSFIFCCLQIGI
jgi:Fanconi anemia group M protein